MKPLYKALPILGLVVLGSCRTAQLHNTGRVPVQASSTEHMREAILQSLAARRWVAAEDQPGLIQATLFVRAHTAKVRIEYDAESFSISYADSNNLKYRKRADGTEYIHGNYNNWVRILMQEIAVRAGRSG